MIVQRPGKGQYVTFPAPFFIKITRLQYTHMAKPILISGIQPTGKLHLGNYLGALKNFVSLQNSGKYDCYFFLADLHSLTLDNFTAKEKQAQILDLTADFLAAGLKPTRSVIFQQSQIAEHSELAWMLQTVTPIGELRRMTQFKDKSDGEKEGANSGLLTYPVLQAADISLYDAKFVPVGEDQLQHLELTRAIVRRFNARYGDILIEPKPLLTEFSRVMSLKDPNKKMSKSDPQSCVFLDDSPEEIKAKVMRATTDSETEVRFDLEKKPGISNLLSIYAGVTQKTIEKAQKEFMGKNYGSFKAEVAEAISEHLKPFRREKAKLIKSKSKLLSVLRSGSKKAENRAAKKMAILKKKTGLLA